MRTTRSRQRQPEELTDQELRQYWLQMSYLAEHQIDQAEHFMRKMRFIRREVFFIFFLSGATVGALAMKMWFGL